MSRTCDDLLSTNEQQPGMLYFGGARMALIDIEDGFWALRRQMEALIGRTLANRVMQQAGANGGASFARALVPDVTPDSAAQGLRDCIAAYQATGFGQFEIETLEWPFVSGRGTDAQDKPIGRMLVRSTNGFEAWMMRQRGQMVESPICSYTAGVLVGFVNALSNRRDVVCVERTCQARGDEACLFELLPIEDMQDALPVAFDPDPLLSHQINLLEVLFDRMPMGIAIFDRDLNLRRCNPTWAEYIGRYTPAPASQVVPGAGLFDLAPGSEAHFAPVLARVLAGETIRLEGFRSESGGIVSYWDAVFTPLMEDGRVVGFVDVTTDATERVSAYQILEQRIEARACEVERRRLVAEGLRDILDALNSERTREEILSHIVSHANRLMDSDACLIYRFEQDRQWMVMESEYGLPLDYRELTAGPIHLTAITQAILDGQSAGIIDLPAYVASNMTGKETQFTEFHRRWFETASTHFRSVLGVPLIVKETLYGGMVFYYCKPREFSEEDFELGAMLGDQAALAIENARLRAQAELLAVVRERERLARDLHDSVTQSLYSLVLLSEAGQRLIGTGDLERVEEALVRLGEIGQQALKEMRLLVYELRPSVLRREGLAGALRHRLNTVERRAGVEANLEVQGSIELAGAVEEGLYRIVQEALNNTLKHAAATLVTVIIRAEGEHVDIQITDNGRGFDANTVGNDGGMGLTNMRERVEKMGGRLAIVSAPGEGTQVTVSVETVAAPTLGGLGEVEQ
jgi:signal transduction histidine kinase/PAS domain-containing protein